MYDVTPHAWEDKAFWLLIAALVAMLISEYLERKYPNK